MSFFSIHNISNTPTLNAGLLIKNGASSAGFIDIYEDSDNGTQKVKIQVPAALDNDYTLTLPTNLGTNNQFLKNNGSGVLSWTSNTVSSLAADNLTTADSSVSIEANDSSISIGAVANTGAINIGTGVAARSITIGTVSVTSDPPHGGATINLNSGTAGTTITGKVCIGDSGLNLDDSDFSNLNVIAQIPKIKLFDNRSNYTSQDNVELGAIEFWSYDTSPASDPPGGIVGKIHITSDSGTAYAEGKLKFATALNGTSTDYMIIDSVGRIKSDNGGGFVNSHVTVQTSNANIDLTDKQKLGNFTLYINVALTSSKDIILPDAIEDNIGLVIKIIFMQHSDTSSGTRIGVVSSSSTNINGIIRIFRDADIDMLTFDGKKRVILNSAHLKRAGGAKGSIYTFHYYANNKIYAECEGIINNSGNLDLLVDMATSAIGL
jgi:hypothetical protein